MPIDPSIPLQVKAPQIADPMEAFARIMQMKGAQQDQQLRGMQMDAAKREAEADARLRQAKTPDEILAAVGPERGAKILTGLQALQTATQGAYTSTQEVIRDVLAGMDAAPEGVRAEQYPMIRQSLVKAGVIKEADAPAAYDPAWFARVRSFGQAPPKPAEAFTLSPGQQRFGPDGKPIANVPDKVAPPPAGFTLSPGQTRYGPDGKPVASRPPTDPNAGLGPHGTATGPTGDALLETLPPNIAEEVKAYAEGRRPFPSGTALRTPYFQKMMELVGQYDPAYDFANPSGRLKTRQDFTAGASAKQITALNTVVGHLGDLAGKADKLGNTNLQTYNSIKNWLKTKVGDSAVTNFNTVRKGVTDELTRVWRQAGGAEADIKTWAESLNSAQSPEQLTGAFGTIAGMLESRLEALENQKQQGLGRFGNDLKIVTPQSRAILDRLKSPESAHAAAAPSGSITVTAPDGSKHEFATQGQADAFKKLAGIP